MAATAAVALNVTSLQETQLGGQELLAQALLAASAQGTGVAVGKGWHDIVVATTAVEVDADEFYMVDIEANTVAAATTWVRIATVFAGGAKEITARAADDVAANVQRVAVYNPHDHQIRATVSISGTIAAGVNVGVKVFPHHS